ncbi:MAG: sulfotransferase domain-containing protein [Spirochaetes bacterium]|nr:sulfotransferase domain-containing protein [Spirochaetota bacterium]
MFLIEKTRLLAFKANYRLGNYKDVIWLIGDGRSGTTWVASLINHGKKYREMFEPFHPRLVKGMECLKTYQYIRPDDPNDSVRKIAEHVFSGKFNDKRVDAGNRRIFHKGLLIKDIFVNLFAYWAVRHFPGVKVVLLIRNPFSVALSKYKTRTWFWLTDPIALLNQPDLYEDYLQPFEGLIRRVSSGTDYIHKQILIWSIINYIPLLQFSPEQIHVVFYEDVYVDPNYEISRIMNYITPKNGKRETVIPEEVIKKPSWVTSNGSNIVTERSPIDAWKNELSARQIYQGLAILSHFGFDRLYRNDVMPNREIIEKLLKKKVPV